jgi:dihydrofolate reductase
MARRLRYQVAVTLDGFIAGPDGGADWIVMDPSIDFAALYREFDTAVMGRRTYEAGAAQGATGAIPGLDVIIFSRSLAPWVKRGVRLVNDDPAAFVRALKAKPGGDVWLFGGGSLFRSLLDAGLVDTVEVAVMPVLLGSGVPLMPPGDSATLALAHQKVLPASGIVVLSYSVAGGAAPPPIRFIRQPKKTTSGTRSRSRRPQTAARRNSRKRG